MKIINSNKENFNRFKGMNAEVNFKGINNPLAVKTSVFNMTTSKVVNIEIRNNFITFTTENDSYYIFEL